MRRAVASAVFALPLLPLVAGCGSESPGAVRDVTASVSPGVTPAPEPLTGFPLAMGLPERNEDDGTPVLVTRRPATRAFELCGRTAWDPGAGTAGVIGVDWSAEAEWSRGRTLVLYPSADGALEAVERARTALAACPTDPGDGSGHTAHTALEYDAGDQSVGWMDRYYSAETDGYDTGLTVFHVARVGRAVLLTYEYGEANGSEQTRRSALARAAKADQPVIDAMAAVRA